MHFFTVFHSRELFRRRNFQWLFPGILMCHASHGRLPWTLSRNDFQCALSQWFLACTLSQGFYSLSSFAGLFRGFSRGFFAGSIFRALLCVVYIHALFRRASTACIFAGILSGLPLSGTSYVNSFAWTFSMGFFAGAFHQRLFTVAICEHTFAGASSVPFFCSNFLCALVRGDFFPCIFSQETFPRAFSMCFPAVVFCMHSFDGDFFHALFCSASSACIFQGFYREFSPGDNLQDFFSHRRFP